MCGNHTWTYLFIARDRMFGLPGNFQEYRCAKCGLVRLQPKPSKEQMNKYYPSAKYYSYKRTINYNFFRSLRSYLIYHQYRPTLLSWILELFVRVPAMPSTKSGRILDIGCGSGETLSLLQSLGWDVYGLDINASAIKVARKQGLNHVSLGSYEDMKKYPDNFFDVIRMYHVIEHLHDPERCLRFARKKLKDNGELIVGTPNAASLIAKVAKQYWYNLDSPRHLYIFTPKTLRRLMTTDGFVNFKMNYCSAGGLVGSLQYIVQEKLLRKIDFINNLWLVIAWYPLEWLLDRFGAGDVFVLSARKT